MSYPNLHSHTYYSVLDGISKPIEIARAAVAMGAKSLAITDHGTLAGWPEFALACKEVGIKPIFGMEAYYVPDRTKHELLETPTGKKSQTGYHLILLAKNAIGCRNIIRLNNIANLEGFYYKPKIDWDVLMQYKEGLIIGSACLASELSQSVLGGGDYVAIARRFKAAFGDDYFIEVMDNQMKSDDQRKTNPILFNLGKSLGIPVVPTNDSHYILDEEQVLHMMTLAIRTKKLIAEITWYDGLFHMKSVDRMNQLFPNCVQNAEAIADKVEDVNIFSENVSVPISIEDPDGILEMLAEGGLRQLGLENMDYFDRLRQELVTIKKLNMSAYFLATKEIVDSIRTIGCEVGWGRGSAGGSLVCFCLGITRIDPLKYNLLFERFVNEYRKDWPDIDLDVPQTLRKAVIQKIGEKFGSENIAHISTVLYFNPKILLRDVCRAMGWTTMDVDRLSKLVPFECHNAEELAEQATDLKMKLETTPEGRMVWDRLLKMLGIPRHVGVHASGIVISNKPIVEQLPIRSEADKRIVQFPMHFHKERDRKESVSILEKFGLLKFDILGLKTLDIIFSTAKEVGIDINNIPLDDPKVLQLICDGRVAGVFQLDDHKKAINICRRMQPKSIEEIAVLLALNRPGMLDSGELDVYLARRFSTPKENWFLHPSLKNVLGSNYGICVYQEDMMRMMQIYAGYSLDEAEELRKAIGKKDKALVERSKALFVEKANYLGHPTEEIDRILKMIDAAGRYSFCKSHATGYAMITYACAYLSVYHPLHFFKNVITMSTNEDRSFYLSEAMIRNLDLLPPDVNLSPKEVTIDNDAIRLGLMSIKRIGEMTANKILANRPYNNMAELVKKIGKSTTSLLHIAGATMSISDSATYIPAEGAFDEIALLGISLYSLQHRFQQVIMRLGAKPIHTITQAEVAIIKITEVKEHISQRENFVAFVSAMDVHGPQADLLAFDDVYKKSLFKKGHFYNTVIERLPGGSMKIASIEEIKGV